MSGSSTDLYIRTKYEYAVTVVVVPNNSLSSVTASMQLLPLWMEEMQVKIYFQLETTAVACMMRTKLAD